MDRVRWPSEVAKLCACGGFLVSAAGSLGQKQAFKRENRITRLWRFVPARVLAKPLGWDQGMKLE
ncbi:hypothetical protein ASF52_09525 [Methylobacterium sp. Leaf112]|nr:hypothetical protein ASF52_09525 [Methylobacterium sp. Leaf112]